MNRQEVLETAIEYVMHDRNKDYKDPEDNFADIAKISNAFYGNRLVEPFTPLDIALQAIFVKLARIKGNPYKMDNYVDIAGYAACAAECAENQEVRELKKEIQEVREPVEDPPDGWQRDPRGMLVPEAEMEGVSDRIIPRPKETHQTISIVAPENIDVEQIKRVVSGILENIGT